MSEVKKNRIRFTKVREVASPTRNNSTDAGIDFYVPTDLTVEDILSIPSNKQLNLANFNRGDISRISDPTNLVYPNPILSKLNDKLKDIILLPGERVLIPSGIKVLIEPENSMLQAANKSGIASRQGLVFTAEIVDSPYVGEMHIGVVNTSNFAVYIPAGKKLIQFIHVPVFLTQPEEISNYEYHQLAETWGTRGEKGFGSSGE